MDLQSLHLPLPSYLLSSSSRVQWSHQPWTTLCPCSLPAWWALSPSRWTICPWALQEVWVLLIVPQWITQKKSLTQACVAATVVAKELGNWQKRSADTLWYIRAASALTVWPQQWDLWAAGIFLYDEINFKKCHPLQPFLHNYLNQSQLVCILIYSVSFTHLCHKYLKTSAL